VSERTVILEIDGEEIAADLIKIDMEQGYHGDVPTHRIGSIVIGFNEKDLRKVESVMGKADEVSLTYGEQHVPIAGIHLEVSGMATLTMKFT
jgi:hypothetical protein